MFFQKLSSSTDTFLQQLEKMCAFHFLKKELIMQTMVVGFTHIILIHKLNMEEVRESRVKSTEK